MIIRPNQTFQFDRSAGIDLFMVNYVFDISRNEENSFGDKKTVADVTDQGFSACASQFP